MTKKSKTLFALIATLAAVVTLILFFHTEPDGMTSQQRKRYTEVESQIKAAVTAHFKQKYGLDVEVSHVKVSTTNDGAPWGTRKITSILSSGFATVRYQGSSYYAFLANGSNPNSPVYDSYQAEEIRLAILEYFTTQLNLPKPSSFSLNATNSTYSYATVNGYYMLANRYYDKTNLLYFIEESVPDLQLYYDASTPMPDNLEATATKMLLALGLERHQLEIHIEGIGSQEDYQIF